MSSANPLLSPEFLAQHPHLKDVQIRTKKPSIYDEAPNADKAKLTGKTTNHELKLSDKLGISKEDARVLIQMAKHELGLSPHHATPRSSKRDVFEMSRQLSEVIGVDAEEREDVFSDNEEDEIVEHTESPVPVAEEHVEEPVEKPAEVSTKSLVVGDVHDYADEVIALREKVSSLEQKMEEVLASNHELASKLEAVLESKQ